MEKIYEIDLKNTTGEEIKEALEEMAEICERREEDVYLTYEDHYCKRPRILEVDDRMDSRIGFLIMEVGVDWKNDCAPIYGARPFIYKNGDPELQHSIDDLVKFMLKKIKDY